MKLTGIEKGTGRGDRSARRALEVLLAKETVQGWGRELALGRDVRLR